MRVLILATGTTEEHNDAYAARLIEQAKAVPAPPAEEKPRRAKRTAKKAETEPGESEPTDARTDASERSM